MINTLLQSVARVRTGYYVRHFQDDQFILCRRSGSNKFGSVLVAIGDSDTIKGLYIEKVNQSLSESFIQKKFNISFIAKENL